ncbi:unnamed protein product [Cylicocyclus nassatus]|uniref:Fungal lipase-type domain-containing protein n=1 Tax=Cylicocyclus nassatus TaxID=53992 RepID=A0AA36DN17_CYLNA|nr:unnamed protein product [Cylicocyclus nassatus]
MQLVYKLFCLTLTFAQLLAKRTNYDELTARKLLNMAAGAYGEQKEKCLNRTFPAHETHVLVNYMEGNCDDGDNLCGCYVNRYFLNGHQVMWEFLRDVLKDPAYEGYKLIFTGHSLGGALAVLAAARTVKEGYRPGNEITIYTFGEPRVGDLRFAESFDQIIPDSYRVVFRRDCVPHLPACFKNMSWTGDDEASRPCDRDKLHRPYHHSTEIWYPASMEPASDYIECVDEPKGEDLNCSDMINFRLDEYSSYIWDHQHYFGVWVYQYGESGCNITLPETKPGLFQKFMCLISPNPDCEEDETTGDNRIEVVPVAYLNALPSTTTEETTTKRSSSFGNFLPLVLSIIGSLFGGI